MQGLKKQDDLTDSMKRVIEYLDCGLPEHPNIEMLRMVSRLPQDTQDKIAYVLRGLAVDQFRLLVRIEEEREIERKRQLILEEMSRLDRKRVRVN